MSSQTELQSSLGNFLSRLKNVRKTQSGWSARCPVHDDQKNSLSVARGRDGRVLVRCFAGCSAERIVQAIGLDVRDLFEKASAGNSRKRKSLVTVQALANDKRLPVEFLRGLGLEDCEKGVHIPYKLRDGTPAPRPRIRSALRAKDGSYWEKGPGSPVPYGLWLLDQAKDKGSLVLVEGESDTWTLLFHDFPALGIPGANMTGKLLAEHLEGIDRLFVMQEPDEGGVTFTSGVAKRLPEIGWQGQPYVVVLPGVKDVNDLHKRDLENFKTAFQAVLDQAQPLQQAPVASKEKSVGPLIPYREEPTGIVHLKQTRDGQVALPLTNFTARIVAEVAEDDGTEVRRALELEAVLHGRTSRFSVPAGQFGGMNWVLDNLGAGAIVYPGQSTRDHARAAIQILSGEVPQRTIFSHVGWRRVGEQWVYLHADGAIGADGSLGSVEVSLPDGLDRFCLRLPQSPVELVEAVRASLRVLNVAPARIVAPSYAAIPRAVLGTADFSVNLAGPTGAGKTELAALDQQHFGAGLDARHLLGSWTSTGNALEALAFAAKDSVLVIDDFAPAGSTADVQRYHREADRVLRAQGNNAGRRRLRSDATLKPAKPPRGLIMSTGEDVPKGQSLRARALILELGPTDLNWPLLTVCQEDGANGLYSKALAGFVRWLAPRYETMSQVLGSQVRTMRRAALEGLTHRRTPDIVANLAVGLLWWLEFAQGIGAIDELKAVKIWQQCWIGLTETAAAQGGHQAANEPVTRFLQLLSAAIASGRAHVANPKGDEPPSPGAWGWRQFTVRAGEDTDCEWRPQGHRVGWLDGEDLYLDADAAYAAAQVLARDQGDSLNITVRTLTRRMKERGLLLITSPDRESLKVRHVFEGRRLEVLHIKKSVIEDSLSPEPDQPDHLSGNLNVFNYKRVRELLLNADRFPAPQAASTPLAEGTYAQSVGLGGSLQEPDEVCGEEVI